MPDPTEALYQSRQDTAPTQEDFAFKIHQTTQVPPLDGAKLMFDYAKANRDPRAAFVAAKLFEKAGFPKASTAAMWHANEYNRHAPSGGDTNMALPAQAAAQTQQPAMWAAAEYRRTSQGSASKRQPTEAPAASIQVMNPVQQAAKGAADAMVPPEKEEAP